MLIFIYLLYIYIALVTTSLGDIVKRKLNLCCGRSEIYQDGKCHIRTSNSEKMDINLSTIPLENSTNSNLAYEAETSLVQCEHAPEILLAKNKSSVLLPEGETGFRFRWINGSGTYETTQYCFFSTSQYDDYSAKVCHLQRIPETHLKKTVKNVSGKFVDCSKNFCISKCCPIGEAVTLVPGNVGCTPLPNAEERNFTNFLPRLREGGEVIANDSKPIFYIISFPFCTLFQKTETKLLTNGSLFIEETHETLGWDRYCVDHFYAGDIMMDSVSVCSEFSIKVSTFEAISDMLHPSGFIISCVFLAVTLVLHILVPKLRDLQGLCFMSYVGSLFLAFLFLSMNRRIQNVFSQKGCVVLGVLNHYFLLAAFFWLNVMCFDIWKVVRKSFKMIPLSQKTLEDWQLLLLYSLYGWGCPLIISIVTISLQVVPDNKIPEHIIRPRFAEFKCWFAPQLEILFAYYYGAVAILFLLNITFIVQSAFRFYKEGLAFQCFNWKKISNSELRIHNRQHLNTFWHRFCLFSLMALNWTTEILSFLPPAEMWIITDIVNTLQGLFIFIIFIRSSNKRSLIKDAWKAKRNKKGKTSHPKFIFKKIPVANVDVTENDFNFCEGEYTNEFTDSHC